MKPTPHKEKMTCGICNGTGLINGPCPGYKGGNISCAVIHLTPCPSCHPEKEKREDAGKCKSCGGPSTYDPKRYQGGTFCKNKGCPAYQEIPAAEEGGVIICNRCGGIYNLDNQHVHEGELCPPKALVPNDPWLTDLLSRTRKEAEERTWRRAVEAIDSVRMVYDHAEVSPVTRVPLDRARQQLITAAKDHGVNVEI